MQVLQSILDVLGHPVLQENHDPIDNNRQLLHALSVRLQQLEVRIQCVTQCLGVQEDLRLQHLQEAEDLSEQHQVPPALQNGRLVLEPSPQAAGEHRQLSQDQIGMRCRQFPGADVQILALLRPVLATGGRSQGAEQSVGNFVDGTGRSEIRDFIGVVFGFHVVQVFSCRRDGHVDH